jgi:dihydrofolate reductase
MSKVIAGFSMSLDGFVADPDGEVEHVFKWYSAGGTDAEVMTGDQTFGMTSEAAEFPEEWVNREGSPFTFVTEGVPKAIDVAREIAGDKDVVVGAPSVTQRCLQLGLLDAIHIDLAPVVLGRGIRLFDHLTEPVELLVTEASGNPHVTHITYRVIKQR